MAENKPTINPGAAAAKIAEQNAKTRKAEEEAAAQAGASVPDESNDGITVGPSVGGSMLANNSQPAGVQVVKRAPGYYSRQAGKVRLGQKVWTWPMEAPLVPTKDEPELKEHLDSMVKRGLATLVKAESDDKSE